MLVSTIISNSLLLADVANTNFYTPAESLFAAQLAWEELYAFLTLNNDDYFVNPVYISMDTDPAVSSDPVRQYVKLIDTTNTTTFGLSTSSDGGTGSKFYRLRLIQYQGYGGTVAFYPASKMTIENFGNTQNSPAYRFEGTNIAVYDIAQYQTYCLWYYPRPVTLTTTTDLQYPYNMIPEVLAYRLALEIRRKQKADDLGIYKERIQELMQAMTLQMSRDDSHGEAPKNQFGQGFAPYI